MQTNLFDLHYRGATVYVDEVRISQKPRDIAGALSSSNRICNPVVYKYSGRLQICRNVKDECRNDKKRTAGQNKNVRPDLQSGRRFLFGLMRRTQQIQNHLYRIESLQRHFHEQRIPVTHGTVPESRKLQSLQFTALIAL